jgi:HTH-type transcriptional regulator, sugar sensing transcriptional regulator
MRIFDLAKIGLTDGETKVYAALLDLGETTRAELAKKSGISPSKIYDVVNRLVEKGIVSAVKKEGALHFSAANPERLSDFLDKKEEDIKSEREIVAALLPSLLASYRETKEKADVEVFYGWEGMRTVYKDITRSLSKGEQNYVFGASMGIDSKQADLFFAQYHLEAEKKGYSINIIFNENVRGHAKRTKYYTTHKQHNVRYLYQDTFTEFNFYKDTVLFVMLLKKPIVIRVKSKEAADSFKKFFGMMWKQAKA